MANIGTFEAINTERYLGRIDTIKFRAKNVVIYRDTSCTSENAPSHRVEWNGIDLGAAWTKRSEKERDYLSLKIDDPSFPATIFAVLVQDETVEGGKIYKLVWSRPENKQNGN
jgi:uncharacterized protein (DUF736 family)